MRPAPRLVIDAHQHFWDPSRAAYPWMAGEAMAPLRRPYGPADLAPLLAASGVDATLLVQCRHDAAETEEFLALAAVTPFVIGVVGWVDLEGPDVSGAIARLRALPGGDRLVGLRHNVHDEPEPHWLTRPGVLRGLEAAFEAGLTFDLLVRSRELPAATACVRHFPGAPFVLDHMAKPPIAYGFDTQWAERFAEIATFDNVRCKVSGLVTEAAWDGWSPTTFDPYLALARRAFGSRRLIFGSDWPVATLAADYGAVKDIAARCFSDDQEAERRLFAGNAIDAYRLEPLLRLHSHSETYL
ncbi:amidohydrolase family protein [Ancylobacter dichloromethanicus]|uniref:Amidohydrolase n=1 Tax=Ancylobacter dichloromethanicus TaxID=518825 RepID=A0A9W6JAX0_9HYPH|nr:amidohydrolase family protein [Ancylobacter dichloromethanicus]MBS7555054.1 amidohydrolase family protein [Ancylobacter dichloromethanicus]GLK72263.1 amidohydrolase [Ancylobacter dichloromethanicus]